MKIRPHQIEYIQDCIHWTWKKYGKDILENKRAKASNAVRREAMRDLMIIKQLMDDIKISE